MNGRSFVDLAPNILAGNTEAHWRAAAGRAYYGLMLECRDALFRWGFKLPARDSVHNFARLRFICAAHPDLKSIGRSLERLVKLRNQADYELSPPRNFASSKRAQQAIVDARAGLALLDALDADPARQAAAIAAIRTAFP